MAKDTLSVPLPAPVLQHYLYSPFDMYGITPFNYGYATWELHKGFNASIGMSVTFSPSKYAPFRSGFRSGCRILVRRTVEQAFQRSRRIVCQQLQLGGINYRNVGITGIAAFKINERISLYAYGNKSLMPKRSPYYYPMPNFAPRPDWRNDQFQV